jgi:DNA topoisomerase I
MKRQENTGTALLERPEIDIEQVVYIEDFSAGILRLRRGQGFRYLHSTGQVVVDERTLRRIRSLAIPPAWKEVWISEDPCSHIQAVGRDERGRRQYRYHPIWAKMRQETKFGRMLEFGTRLPATRRRVRSDLDLAGLRRPRVLACIVRILDVTGARIGTRQYSLENNTFGISSILNRHVSVDGERVIFRYRGKGGRLQEIFTEDRVLAHIIRRCQELPGQRLFEFVDEQGQVQPVSSEDVNAYICDITGADFTSKDFRTWKGSVLGLSILRALGPPASAAEAKRNIVQAMKEVAAELGNRPATARKYYVHPAILEAYAAGRLDEAAAPENVRRERAPGDLSPQEEHFMALLHRHDPRASTSRYP